MTDFKYLLEILLLLCLPLVPVAAGYVLRRKFSPAKAAEGAAPVPATTAQKTGRLAGNILFWGGLAEMLFLVIVVLNFTGRI